MKFLSFFKRTPKDDAPPTEHVGLFAPRERLPTIGARAAEAVRTALDLLERDERAMCAEGLWRECGASAGCVFTSRRKRRGRIRGVAAAPLRARRIRVVVPAAAPRRRGPSAAPERSNVGTRRSNATTPRRSTRVDEVKAALMDAAPAAAGAVVARAVDAGDPHAVTGAVRAVLRARQPLTTYSRRDAVVRDARGDGGAAGQARRLRALVSELPAVNRQLLGRLASHVSRVVRRTRLNKMSWAAAAVALAPVLLRRDEAGAPGNDLAAIAADAKAAARACERLLRCCAVAAAPVAGARAPAYARPRRNPSSPRKSRRPRNIHVAPRGVAAIRLARPWTHTIH